MMTKKTGKRTIALCILLCAAASGFAQGAKDDPAWLLFEQGKRDYREKRFGLALESFKKAAEARKLRFEKAAKDLEKALGKGPEALTDERIGAVIEKFAAKEILSFRYAQMKARAGTSMTALIRELRTDILSERFSLFLNCLSTVLEYRSWESLGDSVPRLKAEIERLSKFPEAEYWIGMIYMLEGEYEIAVIQFDRAYAMRASYEIAEDVYLAMYAKAMCLKTKNLSEYENALEGICVTDPVYGALENSGLRDSMLKILQSKGFDAFATLYRHDASFALKAYDSYGVYLYERARPRAVLVLALAADIILTRMVQRVLSVDPLYSYAYDKTVADSMPPGSDGLAGLFARIDRMPELGVYAEETGFFRILFTLANALYANGSRSTAREIWAALSGFPGAGIYATKAASQLKTPAVVGP